MKTLIVKVDTAANAGLLASFLKTIPYIASVKEEKKIKPLDKDWSQQSARPATDKEIEQMVAESEADYEAGLGLSSKEARRETLKELKEWKKQK